jgi:hypothetical protein
MSLQQNFTKRQSFGGNYMSEKFPPNPKEFWTRKDAKGNLIRIMVDDDNVPYVFNNETLTWDIHPQRSIDAKWHPKDSFYHFTLTQKIEDPEDDR